MITSRTTGAAEGRQVFGPYGEKLPNYMSGHQSLTGYTGYVQQDPSGLIYMRGHYYTPVWHRFLSIDHGMDSSTFNQMAYVGGSPFEAIDPSGMAKVKKGAKAWTKDRKLVECTAEGGCDTGSPEGWTLAEAETGSKTVEVSAPLGPGYQYAPQTDQLAEANNSNAPGYVTFGLSFKEIANITFNFTLSRSGTIFVSPQVGGGASATGVNGSLVAGWINGPENGSGKAVDSFLQGACSNMMAGAIVGGAVTGNGNQTSKEFGLMTPQVSFGYSYGIPLFSIPGVRW